MTPEMQELKDAYRVAFENPGGPFAGIARVFVAVEAVIALAERDDAEAGQAEMIAQASQDGDEPF